MLNQIATSARGDGDAHALATVNRLTASRAVDLERIQHFDDDDRLARPALSYRAASSGRGCVNRPTSPLPPPCSVNLRDRRTPAELTEGSAFG